jgi:peptidoglycan/xylan/chitin deacetylase (PgdA/CDA1 family)
MPTALVCLTFDHDNASLMIARGQMSPTPVSRGDFGIVAVPRILSLLAARGTPSTWFIPGHTIESYPSCVERVRAAGHEIGHHGWTHRPPATMSAEEEEEELLRGVAAIERLTGARPRGYRSPSWDLSPHSVGLLLKHGFVYDSSMMGHDYLPYQVRLGDKVSLQAPLAFGQDTRLVEMPVSWSLDDFPHFEYSVSERGILPGLMEAGAVERNWIDDFLYMRDRQEWGVMTLTFHPHVIGRGHRMLMLERLIERLSREGARFTTLSEAAAAYRTQFPAGLSLRS